MTTNKPYSIVMKNIRKVLFTTSFLFVCALIHAQNFTVKGKITDSEGYEVIGANIIVKGSPGTGTISDLNGEYTLTVNHADKDILVFTYIGMEKTEVPVKGRSRIDVTMKSDALMLDEVVAIGYDFAKRKDLTGSVVSVKSDELLKVPAADITQALAGRVSGVQVLQSEGTPGASISIRVRGGISITQSNEPLYVIDGFPSEDGMASLDPAEIETIDILKDASSTAIYGARGANGVVVITTKSGSKKGQNMTVSFDSYVGFQKMNRKLGVLSPQEFVLLDYERTIGLATKDTEIEAFEKRYGKFEDIAANYANRPGIDWQKEALGRTALTQNYRVGIAGGTDKLKYNAAYAYFKSEGAMVYSGNKKHNINMSLSHKASDRLSVNARITFDQRKVYGMGTSEEGNRFNKMQHILQYRPTIGITGDDRALLDDEDPLLADDTGNVMQNPILSASEEIKNKEYRTFQANGGFTFQLLKGLSFRNNTGMMYQTRREEIFFGDKSITAKRSSINGSLFNAESGSFQTSNVLSYNLKNKKHGLTAMLGHEYVNRWTRHFKASASNFPNDEIGLNDLSLGVPGIPESNVNYDDKLLSFFGRVNYGYADRYLLTASLRADGSSKFGKNNKWGYFPAVSGAWRLIEEEFVRNLNVFSDLKFRIGYGMAGNNRIGSYNSLAILSSVTAPHGNSTAPGYAFNQIPNPNLKWEANKTFNVGFDFGFFKQRLTISPEFYINRSSNLLLAAQLPTSSGHRSMIVNAGATENKGIDLTVNSINIATKHFNWSTNLTFSHNKNTVKELTGESVQLWEAKFGYDQNTHILSVGRALGEMYGYVTQGLYQVEDFDYDPATKKYLLKKGIPYAGKRENVQPGMWKFANLDGNGKVDADNTPLITEEDKKVIGNASPTFYGGINNNFSYKNFDLSIFLTYSVGNDVLNATKLTNTKTALTNKNVLDICNSSRRWMTINQKGEIVTDPAELAALNAGKDIAAYYDMEIGDTYIHSWGVENGSYLKLSNITLGYTFPRKKLAKAGISSLRLYATASNLYTWTKYSGFDPEVSTRGNSLTPGVDFGAYPRSRSFVFGINLSF